MTTMLLKQESQSLTSLAEGCLQLRMVTVSGSGSCQRIPPIDSAQLHHFRQSPPEHAV
jgi:hypothetical protein